MQDQHNNCMNFRAEAIDALQVASEEMLTELFNSAREIAEYTGRDTVNHNDMRFSMGHPLAMRGSTEESQHTNARQATAIQAESS